MRRLAWLLAALAAMAIGVAAAPEVWRFFQVDSCLDRGGRWNYEVDTCE